MQPGSSSPLRPGDPQARPQRKPPAPAGCPGFVAARQRPGLGPAVSMMRKDVNKPKGKTSAYAFFVQTCREEHRKKNPEKNPEQSVNFAEFSKKCSERWKALSASDKKCFEDMAKADKVRYNREMRRLHPTEGLREEGPQEERPQRPQKTPVSPQVASAPRPSDSVMFSPRPPAVIALWSAFFVFCSEYRPSVKQQYPGLSIGDCAKKLGEMWSKLSQSEKLPYEEKAQKLREKRPVTTDTFTPVQEASSPVQDMVAYRGGGTYARNPGSSAQGGEEEEDDEGEEEEEEEDDDE
ncbi:hypothetical protein L3Q82_003701 [Scortum barcoo]|uniref:Uncharacterized protein n=1 Tax=Scortum barcoo TaxID=214431 RepID=A0ACB8X6T4_9TELE|nr:hypothetical protein L3Q82_003701 [Scortum barcoo]